jgi:beta-lactamase regulating signal transducer with metallopeptidase domain
MNLLLHIYPGDAWALRIATVLVQVTVIALAAELLARLGSRWNAAWRHSIYGVAMVCVLASPLFVWLTQASGIALVTLCPSTMIDPSPEPVDVAAVEVEQSGAVEMTVVPPASPQAATVQVNDAVQRSSRVSRTEAPAEATAFAYPDLLRALGGAVTVIWLAGVAVLMVRWCHGLLLIARLRRAARPLESETIAEVLEQVRRVLRVDRLPPLATLAGLDRPIMVGLVRPLVILPEGVLKSLDGPALADVLVHECAHAVCRHQAVGLLQRVAGILYWPHPLIHLLNRKLARAREEVCDNYVLRRSGAPRYARTLLELSQMLVSASPKPSSLGLFHSRWRLEDRVADLLDRRRRIMTGVNRWTAAALMATFLLLALLIAGTRVLQAAPVEQRVVGKLVKDFPEQVDLSTPESAMAALLRFAAHKEVLAVNEVNWVKFEPQLAKDIEYALRHDPNAPKDLEPEYAKVEIVGVLTYRDDLAIVICKGGFPEKEGAAEKDSYGGVPCGRIFGIWKGLGFDMPGGGKPLSATSVEGVTEKFESQKDVLWQRFVEIRSQVTSGRTPIIDGKGGEACASTAKSDKPEGEVSAPAKRESPPLLSEAEKEDVKRWKVETWQLTIGLDMPNLVPQAVQYTTFDKDPVPDFIAQLKKMQGYYVGELAKAIDEARKEQVKGIQARVAWDCGFRQVKGDSIWMLAGRSGSKGPCTTLSSNSNAGKKWIVTKTVDIDGKPVCWCVPVEVKTGEETRVILTAENTFDLRAAYDKVLQEAACPVDSERMKQLVEDYLRTKCPEITARETLDWVEVTMADGGARICYKYLAKIEGNKTKIMSQIFTFDANGKIVSVEDEKGFPKNW